MFYAHSLPDRPKGEWHLLSDHLLESAMLAQRFAERFGAERAAHLASVLHDVGKYTAAFQARLDGKPDRVEHSLAGAQIVMQQSENKPMHDKFALEICAYAIAGHHAGLPDKIGDSGSLASRLENYDPSELSDAWNHEIKPDFHCLMPELDLISKPRVAFQVSVLGRMIFSCLVDADFKDTEAFFAPHKGRDIDRDWPDLSSIIDDLRSRFDTHMAGFPVDDTDLNRLRRKILSHSRSNAEMKTGLFTFTVPTGGGKTLSSLGFALDHAAHHGHSRIIYVAPYTAIIDQTAAIYKAVLGEETVLEHHSAIEVDQDYRDSGRADTDKLRLATEDWAAPIIVTTGVQLFESLFASRTSRCRKLHNIVNSVIILDEAQTLPHHLLAPTMAMIDELARNYGCSIVLCTATQPALGKSTFSRVLGHNLGLELDERELAPNPSKLASVLRRATIQMAGDMTDEALVAALGEQEQVLVIVNTRKHALELYRTANDSGLEGMVHLTTRQHAADRQLKLAEIKNRLERSAPCRVIATSLVEAGVDLDFPRVFRAEAGLDQIAQAAGRCNREGKRAPANSIVNIFSSPDHKPPAEVGALAGDMSRIAADFPDLLSPEAIEAYFGEVYWRYGDALDREKILADFKLDRGGTSFAYRTVAKKFEMIENGLAPVIIRGTREADDAINELKNQQIPSGSIARRLQRYLVQIPPKARQALIASGDVAFEMQALRGDQFAVLNKRELYSQETGLWWEGGDRFDGIF